MDSEQTDIIRATRNQLIRHNTTLQHDVAFIHPFKGGPPLESSIGGKIQVTLYLDQSIRNRAQGNMSPSTGIREQYDDEWLPEDFKPMSLPQLVWHKIKQAPLVGIGQSISKSMNYRGLIIRRCGYDILSRHVILLYANRKLEQVQRLAEISCCVRMRPPYGVSWTDFLELKQRL